MTLTLGPYSYPKWSQNYIPTVLEWQAWFSCKMDQTDLTDLEASMTAQVTAEASARSAADNILASDINSEASTRADADTALATEVAGKQAAGDYVITNANTSGTGANRQLTIASMDAVVNLPEFTGNNAAGTAQPHLAMTTSRKWTSVLAFGAVTGGTVDCLAAFNAALASGAMAIYVPPGTYYLSGGIVLPGGQTLYSDGPQAGIYTQTAELVFADSVFTCVQLGDGADASANGASIRNLHVSRQDAMTAADIPADSVGILFNQAQIASAENCTVSGQETGIKALGGLGVWVKNCRTRSVTLCHIAVDTTAEVRIDSCRFGSNGAFDFACDSYVRISGGSTTGGAAGPNTIAITNCQFNQGQNSVQYWMNFCNQVSGSIADITLFQVTNCYVEKALYGIRTDSTFTNLSRLQITNLEFNGSTSYNFWELDAGTRVTQCCIANACIISNLWIASNVQYDTLMFVNVYVLGTFSCAAPTATGQTGSVVCILNLVSAGTGELTGAFTGTFAHLTAPVRRMPGIAQLTAAPTMTDFNNLINTLANAGIIAPL